MKNNIKEHINLLIKKAQGLSLLYVEDEKELRDKMYTFLNKIFTKIDVASNGEEALIKYQKSRHDIVITDILMPKMNGLQLIKEILGYNEEQEIIITSAYTDLAYLMESIKLGITGYLIKPLDFKDIVKMVEQSIDKLQAFRDVEMYRVKLEEMVEARTKEVIALQDQQIINYEQAINSLVRMIERRDTYTGGHSERVAKYSKAIAKELGLSDEACDLIYQAGILHDIGKIITPDSILLKPGQLSDDEYSLIKEHVSVGYEILREVPMYQHLADIVYSHHERFDGSGYPRSLKGEEIPLFARIMVIADNFDAMTTSRIYKTRKNREEALAELRELSGRWYDPHIIESALNILKAVEINESVNQEPSSHIDDERFAYFFKDPLTRVYNHYYLDFILHKNRDEKNFLCFNILYLKNFTAYNKKHGWSEGDIFLSSFSSYLQMEFPTAQIFRIFGDDFLILYDNHQEIDINQINATPLLKENNLHCDYKHLDLEESTFNSYKDLQEDR